MLQLHRQTFRHADAQPQYRGTDLALADCTGFFIVDPASDPGVTIKDVLATDIIVAALGQMQEIRKARPADNGLKVLYGSASFNDKTLGHGEPMRCVRASGCCSGCSMRRKRDAGAGR